MCLKFASLFLFVGCFHLCRGIECDIRTWYLQLQTKGLLNSDLHVKSMIDELLMKSKGDSSLRYINCDILQMYEEMLLPSKEELEKNSQDQIDTNKMNNDNSNSAENIESQVSFGTDKLLNSDESVKEKAKLTEHEATNEGPNDFSSDLDRKLKAENVINNVLSDSNTVFSNDVDTSREIKLGSSYKNYESVADINTNQDDYLDNSCVNKFKSDTDDQDITCILHDKQDRAIDTVSNTQKERKLTKNGLDIFLGIIRRESKEASNLNDKVLKTPNDQIDYSEVSEANQHSNYKTLNCQENKNDVTENLLEEFVDETEFVEDFDMEDSEIQARHNVKPVFFASSLHNSCDNSIINRIKNPDVCNGSENFQKENSFKQQVLAANLETVIFNHFKNTFKEIGPQNQIQSKKKMITGMQFPPLKICLTNKSSIWDTFFIRKEKLSTFKQKFYLVNKCLTKCPYSISNTVIKYGRKAKPYHTFVEDEKKFDNHTAESYFIKPIKATTSLTTETLDAYDLPNTEKDGALLKDVEEKLEVESSSEIVTTNELRVSDNNHNEQVGTMSQLQQTTNSIHDSVINKIEKQDTIFDNVLHLNKEKNNQIQMKSTDKEKNELLDLFQSKSNEYNSKLNMLELMVMRLENQMLKENLNKQNHTNTISQLENHILKLENEILRLNQSYSNLLYENELMSKQQKKYLELGHESSTSSTNLINLEQINKIDYLTTKLRNQTVTLEKLKLRSEYLEDQNRLLYQMIMNQTSLIAQIMTKVQELSEQNIQQRQQTNYFRELVEKLQQSERPQPRKVYENSDLSIETLESFVTDSAFRYDLKTNRVNILPKTKHCFKLIEFNKQWCKSKEVQNTDFILVFQKCIPYEIIQWPTNIKCPWIIRDLYIQTKHMVEIQNHSTNTVSKKEKFETNEKPLLESSSKTVFEEKNQNDNADHNITKGVETNNAENPQYNKPKQEKTNQENSNLSSNEEQNSLKIVKVEETDKSNTMLNENKHDQEIPNHNTNHEKDKLMEEPSKEIQGENGSKENVSVNNKKLNTTRREILYKTDPSQGPRDCYDYYVKGERKNGIYQIKPGTFKNNIQAYCDMKNGGWTVIQKREDGTTKFFKSWAEYKNGFGGLRGEHWLGNDIIHQLTNQNHYNLKIELTNWEKNKRYAMYDYFMVDDESDGYRLHIEGYQGDAGDGMSKHNSYKFSTHDVDNDILVKEFGGSCAKRFKGAWWYYKCYTSSLNGIYYRNGKIPEKKFDGITWKPWTGPNYSLRTVEMKIRPNDAILDETKQ